MGSAGRETFGVFVPHELNFLQLRHKQMPLGWMKGQRPLPYYPQGIRNGVTLVQTILKGSTSSRFGNVPPYPSVVRDKVLTELAKEVCVVCAADYSYFGSVRGDSVTQALVCYKTSKRRSQAMYSEGEHSTGNFGTIPRGKFVKLCLKPPVALTPRVYMGPIVEAAVPRRSDELPPPSPSKDVPTDLSLRSLSNFASFPVFLLPFPTVFSPSQVAWLPFPSALSPSQLVKLQHPPPIKP